LNAKLQASYEATFADSIWCPLCGQPGSLGLDTHDGAACEAKMAAWQPTGILSVLDAGPLTAYKQVAYMPAPPHELLVDSGGHTCDDTCLTLYGNAYVRIPSPPPWRTRARYRAHRVWWAVRRAPGLRLAHKDRIDQDDE
jgi:hypothetical protein